MIGVLGVWIAGLLRVRWRQVAGIAGGVAVTVALLTSIGAFVGTARAGMTARAAAGIAVDWQVQLTSGTDVTAATRTVAGATGVRTVRRALFGHSSGLTATLGGITQTTGAATVLGLAPGYAAAFPREIRLLAGSGGGVLLAQQTAANLHAAPGDRILVAVGGRSVPLTVDGVVDLPQADSLFQTVGAPPGVQPTAPPDDVVLLPQAEFEQLYAGRADLVTTQLHVARTHDLPPDPAGAYQAVVQQANNLTARLAGAGIVGDDLAAALDAARSDAAYADVLFVFLGLPGVALACLLTLAAAGATRPVRRRDATLLRLRGAPRGVVVGLAAAEGALVAMLGCSVGLLAAALLGALVLGAAPLGAAGGAAVPWVVAAVTTGIALSIGAIVVPTARDASRTSVMHGLRKVDVERAPLWLRLPVDVVLLVGGAVEVALTTRRGYAVVLAPEGVPSIAVDYGAFLGPFCLWLGGSLLAVRLMSRLLRSRTVVQRWIAPVTRGLRAPLAASIGRRGARLAHASTLLAVAVAFAVSTATFNATYQQQAEVDARLTNGADVRVELPATAPGASTRSTITTTAGVARVEPVRHRYAYVGADLQDLYGVDATTIRSGTSLQDAYFAGGTAEAVLGRLRSHPDGVLVSQETARDYQLCIGDRITLRLPSRTSSQPVPVRFTYVGQALEFPTAPRDSFLVANTAYVAAQTRDSSVSTWLVSTDGTPPSQVAGALQHALDPGARITQIGATRTTIGSTLTAVDLGGLTRLELAFALLLGVAAAGVVLVLDVSARRTTSTVVTVLGGSRQQRRAVPAADGLVVLTGGLLVGGVLGAALSAVLVAVLASVFDPPPAALAVPWGYLGATLVCIVGAVTAAATLAARMSRRPAVESLRE